MSKNIIIKEGGTSRTFTANKLRTNLQDGGTCEWVPLNEVDNYVELEELYVTENGIYIPTQKVGFSKEVVDIDTDFVPPTSIDIVYGTAIEDLSKGDCVYISKGGEEVQANIVPCVLDNYNIRYLGYSSTLKKIYFIEYQGTAVYEIPLDEIFTGQPALFKEVDYSKFYMSRNIMSWWDGTYYHFYNLDTFKEFIDDVNLQSEGNQNFFTVMTAKYSQRNTIGAMLIDDFSLVYPYGHPSHYNFQTYGRVYYDGSYVGVASFSNSVTGVSIVRDGISYAQYSIDKRMRNAGEAFTIFKDFFIGGDYLTDSAIVGSGIQFLELSSGAYKRLEHKNGGAFVIGSTGTFRMKYNAEGDLLGIKCDDGLLVLNDIDVRTGRADCSVYTNVDAGASYGFEMFDDYTYVMYVDTSSSRTPGGILYATPRKDNYIVGKTHNKQQPGELGWVDTPFAAGSKAKVNVLFE